MKMLVILPLLLIWNAAKVRGSSILLTSQSIDVDIANRYASITYSFHFTNTDSNKSSELSYQIQLEPNTFISYFYAELNGFTFRGETKEKLEAQKEYNRAVELGLDAVLISQNHDANVFNIMTNIAADGVAVLNITAEQFMLRRFGYYELALTVTNEYSGINNTFASTPVTTTIKDNNGISYTDVIVATNVDYDTNQQSAYQYNIDLTVHKDIASASQALLIRYKTSTMEDHNQFTFDAQSLTLLHVFSYENEAILPRRVVFVLDRSGSMGTTKWDKAVAATKGAINNLKAGIDRMNIILFDDATIKYQMQMIPVTTAVITASTSWLNGYSSGGSTNIHQAMMAALSLIKTDIDSDHPFAFVNQVILITDGSPTAGVTDPTEIQTRIMNANAELEPAQAAIFCLGIGNDYGTSWVTSLNYPMLRGIATQNDGFDARIKESETETILSEYYRILESPVLAYAALEYTQIVPTSLTRHTFRCLYAGTDVAVAAKLADDSATNMKVSLFGYGSGEAVIDTVDLAIDWSNSGDNDAFVVERIWAYLKLLSYRRTLDNPLLQSLLVTQGKSDALQLALDHELVTPWTSMIAVAYVDDTPLAANDTANEDDLGMDEDVYYKDSIGISSEHEAPVNIKILVFICVIAGALLLIAVWICCWCKKRKPSKSGRASFEEAQQIQNDDEDDEDDAVTTPDQVEMITSTPKETTSCIDDQD